MSEWKESKLKDITVFIKDGTHGTHKDVPDGIPLLSAKDIENGKIQIPANCRTISENDYKLLHSYYEIENDDLLLTVVGTIGRVAIVKKLLRKITFQRSVSIIRFDERKVLPDYSFHYFQSNKFQQILERSKNASAQGGVYLGELAKANIYHPCLLSKQKEIAHILTTCDTVIEQTQAAISKYKAIKQGLLHDLFTRGLGADGKLRPRYQDAPELYKESELGWIPREWEIRSLGDFLINLEAGVSVNSMDISTNDHIAVLKTSSVSSGYFYPSENKLVVIKDIERVKTNPKADSIIISRMNTPLLVGECGYVEKDYPLLFLPDRLWQTVFRDKESICVRWLNFLLNTEKYKKTIKDSATGTSDSMKNITKNTFFELKIPMSSINEQNEIAKRLYAIDKKLQSEEALFQKYQSIKRGVMGDLLGGKKTVKVN